MAGLSKVRPGNSLPEHSELWSAICLVVLSLGYLSNLLSNVNTHSKYPHCCMKWTSLGRIRINVWLEMKLRGKKKRKEDREDYYWEKRLIKARTEMYGRWQEEPYHSINLQIKKFLNKNKTCYIVVAWIFFVFSPFLRHPVYTGG